MKKIITYILIAVLALSLIGCASVNNNQKPETTPTDNIDVEDKENIEKEDTDEEDTNEEDSIEDNDKPDQNQEDTNDDDISEGEKAKAVLYFSDENAEYLNGEEREFDELTPEALLNALIEGPKDEANRKTIPDGTKLIDVKIEDNVAYVNFSKELQENHWGGSTGELHTIYSIVNTLALNPELNIDSVQILIEGKVIDSLAGHMDITEPIKPDPKISKVE